MSKSLLRRLEKLSQNPSDLTETERRAVARFRANKKIQMPAYFPDMTLEFARELLAKDPVKASDWKLVQAAFGKIGSRPGFVNRLSEGRKKNYERAKQTQTQ